MTPLSPASVMDALSQIGRDLDAKADEVTQLDQDHVRLKAHFRAEYARAFLTAAGSNDVRRYTAETDTADLFLEVELAEQVLRAAREAIRVLNARLEIGRSIGSILKLEWSS